MDRGRRASAIAENSASVVESALSKSGCKTGKTKSNLNGATQLSCEFGSTSPTTVLAAVLKKLVREACGSDTGTTKLPAGDVAINSNAELTCAPFASVVHCPSVKFEELPGDNAAVSAVAEMTYMRFFQKQADLRVNVVVEFPACLCPPNAQRYDLAIAGHVLVSLRTSPAGPGTARIFADGIDNTLGKTCSSDFLNSALPEEWRRLSDEDVERLPDLLEEAQLAINTYWNDSAQDTQARFRTEFLLTLVGTQLLEFFSKQAKKVGSLFRGEKRLADSALSCCDEWIGICSRLTKIDWGSTWSSPFEDPALLKVRNRLAAVSAYRALIDEITELLPAREQRSLRVDTLWDVFDHVDILDPSPSTESQWKNAEITLRRRLEPVEHQCASLLKSFFASRAALAPQAILADFSNYRQLLKRSVVSKELVSERDSLLARLNERLQSIRLEFEHRADSVEDEAVLEYEDRQCQTGRFLPGVVNNVIWLQQLRSKVEDMDQMSKTLLSDLAPAVEFSEEARKLLGEIEDYEQDTVKNWIMDVKDQKGALTLDANSPLMEIDGSGRVEVNYPERLVQLIREVRVFNALGIRVPADVQKMAKQGLQFYQSGVALKQVAETYNSMQSSIIPCTQAMLLEPAVRFEGVVAAGGDRKFTWKNSTDSERFIDQLRAASHSLTDDNRRLRRLHDEIGAIVRELFDVDLLRNKERWMGRVHAIRDKMEGSGFRNMEAWKRYWDMQLYKALEYQYQLGLECLHEVVEEIKADIVYDAATGRAALRPSLEVIREQYYHRIRDFLTFPLKFQGCGETDMFKSMPGYNEQGIFSVLKHASQLFKKVSQELKRLSPLLVIGLCGRAGAPTLEAIVGEALTEVQQWEQNIRLLKQKGKEINSVELFIKIDCITLCTAGVKSAVEEHLFKLADALNVTLRKSAEQHLTRINAYLEKVSESLDAKLTKLDEIGQANLVHAQLVEQRPSVEVEMHNFYNKNKLLQSTTNTRGIEFAKTKKNWDYLVGRLDSHEKEMEEQLNKMRNAVDASLKTWMKDLERFTNQWHELKPKSIGATNATKFVGERKEQFAELKARGEEVVKQCAFFQLDEPDLQPMEDVETDINEYWSMWAKLDEFQEDLAKLKAEPWITLRSKLYRFDDFVVLWQEKLKELPNNPITVHIRSTLNEWGRCTPTLKFVRGDGFTPLHWNELFALLGLRNVTQDTLTFGQILDKYENVLKKEAELKKLHARAQGEAQIREALDDVRAWGSEAKLVLVPHADRKGVMLVTDWKDTLNALSDNQALLLSVKDSPFFSAFASDANQWEMRLAVLDEYLHHMNQIQRKWVYLEPIFRRGALPEERDRFNSLDREYLAIMSGIAKDPRLLDLVSHTEYKEKLGGILEQLDRCQKSLNEFLETKRDRFSRFYFISDDDLLEILAQSKNPAVIQQHLKKLFMGIHSVGFDSQKENILQMRSAEGEAVPLENAVRVTDEVEEWLTALDEEMKRTISAQLVRCVEHLDIGAYPSQVLCTAEMITFTRKTEEAIRDSRSGALRQHRANLQAQLKDLTSFAAKNNDHVIDLKVKALIMDLIHNIEVVGLLDKENIDSETSWLWRKQLRYYLDKKGSCVLRMVDAEFKYTYEYQGNAPKLVHTPLTDRCYLTLTQGMQLGYGGNPYGPAGTGKTESVKALGNAMGRQVLVFNCDEGIDFKSMGRIFAGLVKCGAWGCFDEFNRLKIDQLSAISQMIQVIQESLKNGDTHCPLLEKDVEVNPSAGIFVTLNPAGKGYGGRTKLPDNLKQLFRSVAMSAPDDELIAETILLSEGFVNASEIARKTVEIFRLSKQLLSRQQHYDWGLRAIKAVLRLGGTLIHQFSSDRVAHGKNLSDAEVLAAESEIIIQSLRVNTLSKLTFDDAVLFNGLVGDVFPDVAIREVSYEELRPALNESVKDLGLQLMPAQVEKALQLYEALRQRMGVVLVGPSGSGKSTLLHLLRKAMQRLGVSVPLYAMNPKAMPRTQLLGHMDSDTREWYEGVLTEAAKKVVREESEVRSWILCDGDIDPEWIESLNSVLDDNKLLTMPNGVRIQFGSNVNFLFETHSLESASPATVSRMGIIYLSEEDVDPRMAVASWLQEQPEESRAKLQKWINDYFYSAIDSLLVTGALVVETTRTGLVMSGLSQLSGCTTKEQFTMGLIYGLGSYLAETHRKDYAKDVLYLVGERAPDPKAPLDFYYDTQRGMYKQFEFEPSLDLTVDDLRRQPMVRTVDCQRNMTIMQAWTQPVKPGMYRPFVLVGPEGCGKSMLLSNLFRSASSARVATVNCAAHTVASHVIQKLKQTCQLFNTNKGRVLRPKEAERLVLLLKDLNLPKPDKYGTVQLHSFLQQLILYNGFYDNDLEWVNVERVQVVGSMSPPGSMGRYPVSSRFLAIVSVLSISYPSSESLQKVYTDFLNVMFQSQRTSVSSSAASGHGSTSAGGSAPKSAAEVARVMTAIYQSVVAKYTVDDASHYVFNPRDLTNWTLNIMNYATADVGDSIAHECRRIFIDRLISSDDRTKVTKVMQDHMTSFVGHGNSCIADKETDFYVSWLDSSSSVGKKKLTLASAEDVKKSSELGQLHYSREYADLDLQLIPETCAWIARIDRILSQERGNALLVARSGMGASGIIRLVSFLCRMDVITPGITREYTVKQFNAEVKQAMVKAGVEGQHVTFLLEEHQLVHAGFLETINSLLSSGEVPGLFTHEELDAMLNPLREDALGEGMSTYEYFVDRVSRFLHVCVVMDPTDRSYETRCRANPALFTRCSVCWMGTWTSDSLKVVPRLVMKDVYAALDGREDKKSFSLTSELVHMHRSMGDKFSPKHFKVLCETYTHLFTTKRDSVSDGLERLKGGLSKLAEAQESVDKISHDVTEKKTLMEAKQKEADDALTEIQVSMEESGEQKKSIQKIQKELAKEQKAVEERKAVIEERLGGIQPTLDAARSSVNSIRPEHLSELKSMKQPPAAVQDVMEAVILLISGGTGAGGVDTNWASIRKILAGDIKGQILGYDIDNVSDTLRSKVEKYINSKASSFKREVIERASKAAAPMCQWLLAVIEYSKVLETVAPMRAELQEYEANLEKGRSKKTKYEGKLGKVEEKIEELKTKFGEKTKEAERLKTKVEKAEKLLQNASDLLAKLSGEKVRWKSQAKAIASEMDLLPRRALMAAAFIVYLGREPEDVRRVKLDEWMERQKTTDFNFFTFLRSESVQLKYKAQGLPGDQLSMDNAVLILEQVSIPLIEDPAGQAVAWLSSNLRDSTGKQSTFEMCSISDERLVSTLELALRFGKTLVVTDVDSLEPFMYPLFRKELRNEGTKRVLQIGDRRTVDYGEGFRLFLVTRQHNMYIPPDVISYVTPVSFSVTQSGLEGQFLGITIQHEQPELEQQKTEVLAKEESLKLQLAELEESLLNELATSEGSLLENTKLIESLNDIKSSASEIEAALATSKEVQEQLDLKRNVYRPFAATGSEVFFLVKSLKALCHMYQFSLTMFIDRYHEALRLHKDDRTDIDSKIHALKVTFVKLIVKSVTDALFKEHRTTFGVHLSRCLFKKDFCSDVEWSLFIDSAVVADTKKSEVRVPTWVLESSKESFRSLAVLLPDIVSTQNFQEADVWLQWMRTSTPEKDYPSYFSKVTPFQQLLIIKTLRPDRLVAAMNHLACEMLHVSTLNDSSTLPSLVDSMKPDIPMLLITTSGADPSMELQTLAYERVGRDQFHQIAMGGGQTDHALQLLKECAENGHWIFLKNLHLVIPWVSTLQKELNLLTPHKTFRLFLTTESHDEFPSILLSQSLKVTFEAPPGVKQNLLRTYKNWGAKRYEAKGSLHTQLLFVTAWMHAILQERLSYVPQGWTQAYEFTVADLKAASDIVEQQSSNNGDVDWRSIHGILDSAIYGGRMESDFDVRILRTYLSRFFRPDTLATAKKQRALHGKIKVIGTGKYADFTELIENLPDSDVPAVFSLPPNSDRVVQLARVRRTVEDLQRLHEAKEASQLTREEWAARLEPLLNSWSELTQPHSDLLTHGTTSRREAKPMEAFVNAEVAAALGLVQQVETTMNELRRVLDGALLLTEDRRSEAAAMILGEVPSHWDNAFTGPSRILLWLQSLLFRATTVVQWQSLCTSGSLLKTPLKLAGILRPKTFLNVLRQETAHSTHEALVSLKLASKVGSPPENTVMSACLSGLLLQGAVLDDNHVLKQIESADSPGFFTLPDIYVGWTTKVAQNDTIVSVPVYSNATKENFLLALDLACDSTVAASELILSGVAIMLEQ